MRTARLELSTSPERIGAGADDSIAGRTVTVVAQESGTIVVCDSADTDPSAQGCRVPVAVGDSLTFSAMTDLVSDHVYLAVASGTLDVDVVVTGVA